MSNAEAITFELDKATWHIFPSYCKGCGLCIEKCPTNVLVWSDKLGVYGTPSVKPKDKESCIACGICRMVCPDCAILVINTKTKKAV